MTMDMYTGKTGFSLTQLGIIYHWGHTKVLQNIGYTTSHRQSHTIAAVTSMLFSLLNRSSEGISLHCWRNALSSSVAE